MATVTRKIIANGKNLDPGYWDGWTWNAPAANLSVFALSVRPIVTFQNNTLIDSQPAVAQIRNIRTIYLKPIAYVQSASLQIKYEIHNVGNTRIDYTVSVAIID